MLLKVCGMRERKNIEELEALAPDMMGLIFYPPSSRFAGEIADPKQIRALKTLRTVGVFVNAAASEIIKTVEKYGLNLVQLHGQESPEYCEFIQSLGVGVIKVFSVGNGFDFSRLAPYEPYVDYFLFDTKGKLPGGNGITFNWEILAEYPSAKPFLLSGGIGLEDQDRLRQLNYPKLVGIDVNSRFEIAPAHKDISQIQALKSIL